jgi:hypothetical protein
MSLGVIGPNIWNICVGELNRGVSSKCVVKLNHLLTILKVEHVFSCNRWCSMM